MLTRMKIKIIIKNIKKHLKILKRKTKKVILYLWKGNKNNLPKHQANLNREINIMAAKQTEYDNTNRLALFSTNARAKKAPSHSGTLTISADLLEENQDGTYTIALTAWAHEEGHIFGVASSNEERVAEREAYLASRKPKGKAATGNKGKK